MKKKILSNILLLIFISAFLISGYYIIIWLKSDKETKELEEGLYAEVITEKREENSENKIEDENEPESIFEVDFEKLKNTNEDIFAWIKIDDTYINYPILKGETDEYYLRRNIYKKSSVAGSIFVDSSTDIKFNDDNTSIYGHNMKNQRMFQNLHKIKNGNLGTDINVQIYTPEETYIYKVFSAYSSEPNDDIIKKNFENIDEKKEYINKALNKSNIKFDVNEININYENKILTLITCDNNNKNRIIINAII